MSDLTREQIEELFERSKDDRAIIVGSEVRQLAAMALRSLALREQIIEECKRAIRAACGACDGKGGWENAGECEYCGRPMRALDELAAVPAEAQDAARWRGLIECARVRVIGYARGGPRGNEGAIRHIGFEFTTDCEGMPGETSEGVKTLIEFVDAAIDAHRPGPTDEAGSFGSDVQQKS